MTSEIGKRSIDYLRISVTDRCDLRCVYCMPPEGVPLQAHSDILSYEEIERVARAAAGAGLTRIRLTGGEPLVRKDLASLVSGLGSIPDVEVALTTNGVQLARYADALKAAGLSRVNVSLDSLDPAVFERVTRGGQVAEVLDGIRAAVSAGLEPVKVNVVVVRSLEQDLTAFADLTRESPVHVRFIEYMPLGETPLRSEDDFVPAAEILSELGSIGPLVEAPAPVGWGPARYFRLPGASGTIGLITPRSDHFCGTCNRLRLTADGQLRACLFYEDTVDVRTLLRSGADDAALTRAVEWALAAKPAARPASFAASRTMSQVGG